MKVIDDKWNKFVCHYTFYNKISKLNYQIE